VPLQRAAADVLHDDVAQVALVDRVVDRRDVRVAQLAHERGLVEERALHLPAHLVAGERVPLHQLDGDALRVERVLGEEHAAGGAGSQRAQHRVLADFFRQRVAHRAGAGRSIMPRS
jgi:hypothetical protein